MNWTGGKLQRHSKSNSNKTIGLRKQYFAKARSQSQAGLSLLHPKQPGTGYQQKQHLKPRLAGQIIDVSGAGEVEPNRSCEQERKLVFQDHKSGSPPESSALEEDCQPYLIPRLDTERPKHDLDSFENVKQDLLHRSDWSGISVARPLKISFASRQSAERIGRPRRLDSGLVRQRRPQQYAVIQQDLGNDSPPWYSTGTDIRSDLNISQMRRTINSSQQQQARLALPQPVCADRNRRSKPDGSLSNTKLERYKEENLNLANPESCSPAVPVTSSSRTLLLNGGRGSLISNWQDSKRISSINHHGIDGSVFEAGHYTKPAAPMGLAVPGTFDKAASRRVRRDHDFIRNAETDPLLDIEQRRFDSELLSHLGHSTAPGDSPIQTVEDLDRRTGTQNVFGLDHNNHGLPTVTEARGGGGDNDDGTWLKYVFSQDLSQSRKDANLPIKKQRLSDHQIPFGFNTRPSFLHKSFCTASLQDGSRPGQNAGDSTSSHEILSARSSRSTFQNFDSSSVMASLEANRPSQMSPTEESLDERLVSIPIYDSFIRSYCSIPDMEPSKDSPLSWAVGHNEFNCRKRTALKASQPEEDIFVKHSSLAQSTAYCQPLMRYKDPPFWTPLKYPFQQNDPPHFAPYKFKNT